MAHVPIRLHQLQSSNNVSPKKVMLVLSKVKELHGLNPTTIGADVLSSPEPLLLRGYGADWPVVKAAKLSLQAAVSYLSSLEVPRLVTTCRGAPETLGRVFYNQEMSGFNFEATHGRFADFLHEIINESVSQQPRTLYMPSTDANVWFPSFVEANCAGLDHLKPIKLLWAGNKTRIAAHYDFPDNLACSVVGRRRFTLFPPEQIVNLYPGPMEFAPGGQEISLVDFSRPDFQKFPKFALALEHALEAELSAGDALFLPGMWWHHVEGLDDVNVLYTHWWRSSPAFMGRPANALLHSMMSLRGLSPEQRSAWRALFDHYVFNADPSDIAMIPEQARGILQLPLDESSARKIRAELLNRLKV